jgi:signal transduction histidine kinase
MEAETDVGSRSAKKLRAGDRLVRIEIADNGVGIVAEKLGNVFDPFFTTKPTGAGMGLGLTVCRKTVELHGGQISVESEPGKGTRVIVDLPVEE